MTLLGAALAAACAIAARATGWGDYPNDAGPALSAIAHGHIGGFFSHQAAMGSVSLYIRAPFAAIAGAFGDSQSAIYRWGNLPCLIAVALFGWFAAREAGRRGTGPIGRTVIIAICLFNPLTTDALFRGHPEELLTAALAAAALLAATRQATIATAVLAGLAVASKQWALLIVCPCLLALHRDRVKAGLTMLGTAAAATLPMVIANERSFRHVLHYISTPQPATTIFNWLYPLSTNGIAKGSLLYGPALSYTGRLDLPFETTVSHPLIILAGIAIPLVVWHRGGNRLTARNALLCAALALLLRCTLDPGTWPYYHVPLLLTLVALDAISANRLPIASLAATAVIYAVLDRLPNYLTESQTNALYIAVTITVAAVLVRELGPAARGSAPHPSPTTRRAPTRSLAGQR